MKNDMHLKEMRFGIAALCRPIKWPLHLLPLLLLVKFSKGRKDLRRDEGEDGSNVIPYNIIPNNECKKN